MMIEVINIYVREPGVWVLMFMSACALITLVASLFLRSKRVRLLNLVNEIIDEGRLTKADKAWISEDITRSKGAHLLIVAPFAPFAIFGALVLAAYEAWAEPKHNGVDYEIKKRIDDLDKRIDVVSAKIVLESNGVDPRSGIYWNDPRRKEIEDLTLDIETWNNPIAMVWIAFWLAASAPLMAIAYLASGSLKPFILNIWEPLRDPIYSVLSAFHFNIISHRL